MHERRVTAAPRPDIRKDPLKKSLVICPGSFDPPTMGHLNIVERALKHFKKVIVAVAINTSKATIFSPEERMGMLRKLLKEIGRAHV